MTALPRLEFYFEAYVVFEGFSYGLSYAAPDNRTSQVGVKQHPRTVEYSPLTAVAKSVKTVERLAKNPRTHGFPVGWIDAGRRFRKTAEIFQNGTYETGPGELWRLPTFRGQRGMSEQFVDGRNRPQHALFIAIGHIPSPVYSS